MAKQPTKLQDFPFFSGPKPRVFGHRGAAGTMPENTLPSFRRALEEGATHIELDIHETGDGEIVIIHDPSVDRTTDGQGQVAEMGTMALKRLDAGYWWSADGGETYPHRGQGVSIPTLGEFFEQYPGVCATVEAKTLSPKGADSLFDRIENAGRVSDVLLASFDDEVMGSFRQQIEKRRLPIATGHSFSEIHALMTWLWMGCKGPAPVRGQALQIPCSHEGQPLITEESVRAAHALGLEVHAWTINQTAEMQRLLDLGVDGIVTDFPVRMRAFVG